MNDDRDNGYMYWELRGGGGGLYEAGMFTHTGGADINPYLSASFGNRSLNNPNARYACGNYLGLMAGVVNAQIGQSPTVFVEMGNIPNYNPANAFEPTETVTMQNAAWIFMPASPDLNSPGVDAARVQTPCVNCSISKVTSIAQKGGADRADFSYFGLDSQGNDAIHWVELIYGEWQQGCEQGAAVCDLVYTANQTLNYAGQQNYPSANQADAIFSSTGVRYETYDGVEASTGIAPSSRHPAGAFVAHGPPSCAADGYGYCVAWDSGPSGGQIQGLDGWGMNCAYYPMPAYVTETYMVMVGSVGTLRTFTSEWVDDGSGTCTTVQRWNPAEPSQFYSDPSLP